MHSIEKEPLFSVLIANFNNGEYLMEAIESVYSQSYTNWEIILVDDCSSDNSRELYNKLANDSRIKILYNNKNEGCGYTKKRCVDEAQGEICGFLDPDDALSSDALDKMLKAHLSRPTTSIIYSRFYLCDGHLNVVSESSTEQQEPNNSLFFNFEGKISHFSSFKKEYYLKTEGINPYLKRAVDQDLYIKLYDVGNNYFLDEILYYYRIHNNGISTLNNADKAVFWHWIVIMDTAKRRNVNVEDLFYSQFVYKKYYYELLVKYNKLKKYERLNIFLAKIKNLFRG